jgi:hypothetical protein
MSYFGSRRLWPISVLSRNSNGEHAEETDENNQGNKSRTTA